MRLRTAVAVGWGVIVPCSLGAQVCIGNPSLSNVAVNLTGGASFYDGGKDYSASAIFGSTLFGGASFTYSDIDDTDLSLKSVGAAIGYDFPNESQASFCLGVTGEYAFGLEILGYDITGYTIGPFIAAGLEAEVSPTVAALPFASLGWFYQSVTVDGGPLGDETETDDAGALSLGVSFLFNQMLALAPVVSIPLGVENGNTAFGVRVTIAAGRTN